MDLTAARLYGFVDTAYLRGRDAGDLTRALVAGGVDLLQVRAKDLDHAGRVALVLRVRAVAAAAGVPVIVNDDLEAAFECGAEGIHLGQEDWAALPRADRVPRLARMSIVGISTHSLAQALQAERDGASYIGVGPVHPTATKPGRPAVGLELVRQVAARVGVPFFAIGGITLDTLDPLLAAGATRVAVVAAILTAPDVTAAAAEFKRRVDGRQGG
ncbi:thiamine phosphate synthase [bacterium]|nr:thiamine phosphate synthase [bacterium]